jgi:hypothetical protein
MEHVHLYRKESLERIESPEQLNQVLRVTNPSVWLLLTAVILLLVGLLVWGSFTYIDSVAYGRAEVTDGVMTLRFDDEDLAKSVEEGMLITVGETSSEIRSLGRDEQGVFALADNDLADGEYAAGVRYRQTQILRLLLR